MRRTLLLGLAACLTATSVGCMACGGWSCGPMGPICTAGVECGPSACDDCGGFNACTSCGDACCEPCAAPCGDACCDPCGPCGPCETGWGPLTPILGVLFQGCYWGCDGGCGEIWWGDFHGAPPVCTDPCDCCGNWTGQTGWAAQGAVSGCASGTCSMNRGAEIPAASVASHTPQGKASSQPVHYSLPQGAQFISESDRVVVPAETQNAVQATAPTKPRVQAKAVSQATSSSQWTARR